MKKQSYSCGAVALALIASGFTFQSALAVQVFQRFGMNWLPTELRHPRE